MNNRVNCPLHNATIIRVDSFNSSCLVKLDKANIGCGLVILVRQGELSQNINSYKQCSMIFQVCLKSQNTRFHFLTPS